jgi:hypothetical protein
VVDRTAYRATAESAFRLLWQRVTDELRDGWLLVAQLPSAWFSRELADALELDLEIRREMVRLHILERDNRGWHQMHRLLGEFARAEVPDGSWAQSAAIAGATDVLETGDPSFRFQRYSRDAACFEYLLGTAPDEPGAASLKMACGIALQQLGDLAAARVLYEQALASAVMTYGHDHPIVAAIRSMLVTLLQELGELLPDV